MSTSELFWTKEKIEKLRKYAFTNSTKGLAEIFGVTRNSIAGICNRVGISINNGRSGAKKIHPLPKLVEAPKIVPKVSIPLLPEIKISHEPIAWPPGTGKCLCVIGDPKNLKA